MNYEEMSDLEISARVLTVKGVSYKIEYGSCLIDHGYEDGAWFFTNFNPCNKFEDWYAIAEMCGMSMSVNGRASIPKSVSGLDEVISHTCKGKLGRAVSICFLKMKDAENE
ncbi:MAG: hypothetical protein GY782_03670 [Gammaproteobacteria bacterium]|nr:hypothetical protein [Gammaproteobacteria bacterium]